MSESGRTPSPDLIVAGALGANMPLRMSPLGLAQEVLRALREAGFVVACAECNSSTSGIHYVDCSMSAPARSDR